MGLYLGSNKCKLNLNDIVCYLNLYSDTSTATNGIKLLTSDGYILKDSNGVYITLKSEE